MSATSSRKSVWLRRLGGATIAAALTLGSSAARAEGPTSPDGKGIAGGILLGAELIMIIEAIAGVEEIWPYPVFGGLGAAAGGVGGYFVETTEIAEPALYMLAGGMALVVPTIVATLNATAYDPDSEEEVEYLEAEPAADAGEMPDGPPSSDEGPAPESPSGVEQPPATSPAPPGPTSKRRKPRPRRLPPSLLGLDAEGFLMGVPAVEWRPTFSDVEVAKYGESQRNELHIPLIYGSF